MSVTPADLLTLATELQAAGTETSDRSSISRAYYALYHRALAWESALPDVGSAGGGAGGSHQQLINRLSQPGTLCPEPQRTAAKKLAAFLRIERDLRHRADYELEVKITSPECRSAIARIERHFLDYPSP